MAVFSFSRRKGQGQQRLLLHLVRLGRPGRDRKSTRLNSSHVAISYAVFCLKKKTDRPRPSAAPLRVSLARGGCPRRGAVPRGSLELPRARRERRRGACAPASRLPVLQASAL